MIDPTTITVDIDQMREWLKAFRDDNSLSWKDLEKATSIPGSTLGLFVNDKYMGQNQPIADKIHQYRQLLQTQSILDIEAPVIPPYYDTPTASEVHNLLSWSQRGKMVYAALGSGIGKTMAIKNFRTLYPNVFVAEMEPSSSALAPMLASILEALGEQNASGSTQGMNRRIREKLSNMRNALVIVDEAQELTIKSIEELRRIHDRTGTGIALVGDIRLAHIIENGSGKGALPQLKRRMLKMVRSQPLPGDIDALARAWNIEAPKMVGEVRRIATLPGGLGIATLTLELATMLASAKGEAMDMVDLRSAWSQISGRGPLS